MSILVACTCGKNYKLVDSLARCKAICPACGASIDVPEAESLGDSSLLTLIDDDAPEAESLGDSTLLTLIDDDDDDAPPGPEPKYEFKRPTTYSRERPQTDYELDPSPMYLAPGETMASNPGRMRPNLLHYYKCYPTTPIMLIVGLMLSWVAANLFGLSFGAVIAGAVLWVSISDWLDIRRKCRLGDVNPGLVVSVKPPLVAVVTDLSMTGGAPRLALKILPQPLGRMTGGPPEVGAGVATVSQYYGNQDGTIWNDFRPDVINCVTTDMQTIERKLFSIPSDQCDALFQAVERLSELKPGLYRMWEAGWQKKPLSLASPIGKVVGALLIVILAVTIGGIMFGKPRENAPPRPPPNNASPPPEAGLAQRQTNHQIAHSHKSKLRRPETPFRADARPDRPGRLFPSDSSAPAESSTEKDSSEKDSSSSQSTEPAEARTTATAGTEAAPASGSAVDVRNLKVGDRLEVEWGSKWWPATVVQLENGKVLIHYEGWSSTFDEWLGADRMRTASSAADNPKYKRGDKVEFNFANVWRSATVEAVEGDRVQVREDGAKFPRWITADRLRYPTQEK